jgi:hypothetical protein
MHAAAVLRELHAPLPPDLARGQQRGFQDYRKVSVGAGAAALREHDRAVEELQRTPLGHR